MSEYIERDDILADIDELKKSPWYTLSNGHFEREEAIDIVTKLCILKQPTADVAPVVRCKDCKFNVANMERDTLDITDYTDITCAYFMTDGMNADDYCSRGEEKGEGD